MKMATQWQEEAARWLAQHYRMRVRGKKQPLGKDGGGHESSMQRRLDRHLQGTLEHRSWDAAALKNYIKRYGQHQKPVAAVWSMPAQGTTTAATATAKRRLTRASVHQAGKDADAGQDVDKAVGENKHIGVLQEELNQQKIIADAALTKQKVLQKALAAIQAQVAQLVRILEEHTAPEALVPAS